MMRVLLHVLMNVAGHRKRAWVEHVEENRFTPVNFVTGKNLGFIPNSTN
jgi:hypothetical protein